MIKNKKAIAPIIFIVIGIVVVLFLIIAGIARATNEATSLTPPVAGCNEPLIFVEVFGDFVVKDGSVIGIEPEVDRIENVGIRASRTQLAFLEPFNYEVILRDKQTKRELSSFEGSAKLSSAEKELRIPFNLFYKIKDRNCDNEPDDTTLTIIVKVVETKDIFKDTSTLTQDYVVRDGRIS